jgi:hypothetical protein
VSVDRVVSFLHSLGGASTSRVLNLGQIAKNSGNERDYIRKPMFRSPVINTAFILKHRMRSDESYMFSSVRSVATKLIAPFDLTDLRAGGRSIFVEQRGFVESVREVGRYNEENLERDLRVLRLMNAIPSLDPFLLREHLRNHDIEVAPCYFEISARDQQRMHDFVAGELSRLIALARGGAGSSADRMVNALLSSRVDEKLEPLRATLGLSVDDFREGVFSWRGFLYYKWSMAKFWPGVMEVLKEIKHIVPHGAATTAQKAFLAQTRRSIIEMVHDNGKDVDRVLDIYNRSFEDLVTHQAPKSFRDFLLSAPFMFLDLGEKTGAIAHVVSFWRYRFPPGAAKLIDAEELGVIFQDFSSGFGDRGKYDSLNVPKPELIRAG